MTKEIEDGFFESHKQYIDIHVVIEGEENWICSSVQKLFLQKNYDAEGDYELLGGKIKNIFY